MRDCPDGTLRDSLPLYASGKLAAADKARIESHLASCADCTAELGLLRTVARAYLAPEVDVAAVAARIPARHDARGVVRTQVAFHRQPLWQMAAGITFLIAGTASVMVIRGRAPQGASVVSAPQGASVVSAPQGASVVSAPAGGAAAETTLASTSTTSTPGTTVTTSSALLSLGTDLSELTDAQLQSLLGSLDGIDARPQADPTTIATPIIQERTQAPGRSNQ